MDFEFVSNQLASSGFVVIADFLPESEVRQTEAEIAALDAAQAFHRAGVGQADHHALNSEIRRDRTAWFEPNHLSEVQHQLWRRLLTLKEHVNQTLFLGLWDLEGHYAIYEPGGFYQRHLDRFRSDDARTVTVVIYYNSDWRPGDGGELEIFPCDPDAKSVLVEPRAGTLVCFLSDRIEHEVKTSNATRLSFAGWFRTRPVGRSDY